MRHAIKFHQVLAFICLVFFLCIHFFFEISQSKLFWLYYMARRRGKWATERREGERDSERWCKNVLKKNSGHKDKFKWTLEQSRLCFFFLFTIIIIIINIIIKFKCSVSPGRREELQFQRQRDNYSQAKWVTRLAHSASIQPQKEQIVGWLYSSN